jgi:hypothetical protein
MKKLDAAVNSAERLARSDQEKLRVRVERLMYDYLRDYVALEKARQDCRYADAVARLDDMIALKGKMNEITPFFGWRPYPRYGIEWEKKRMESLLRKTSGPEGQLLTVMPKEAKFRTDEHDDGIYERWQETGFDDSDWDVLETARGWQNQGHRDKEGHDYNGLAWYRLNVKIPKEAEGKEVHLFCPAVVNEAWVWVNGKYAGRKPYQSPWKRPSELDVDISEFVSPGGSNQITIRVLCNDEVFGANGIYERMFLYSAAQPPAEAPAG